MRTASLGVVGATRVGRGHDGRRRELGDRDVIRMPVRAVRPERHDDVGPDAPQVTGDARDRLARIRPIELLIAIVEQRSSRARPAPRPRRAAPLSRISASATAPGMLGRTGPMPAVSAGIAARGGQQKDVDAFGRVLRQRAADAQRFVVGMGEHREQPRCPDCGSSRDFNLRASATSRLTCPSPC